MPIIVVCVKRKKHDKETLKKKLVQTKEGEREETFAKITSQTRLQEQSPKQPIDNSLYAKEEQERDILNMNTNMISGNNSEDDFMGSSFMKGINNTSCQPREMKRWTPKPNLRNL